MQTEMPAAAMLTARLPQQDLFATDSMRAGQSSKRAVQGKHYFNSQRSADAPSVVCHLSLSSGKPLATALERGRGEADLRRGGGVELRRRRLGGGEGLRFLALTGEGLLRGLLAGEGERLLLKEEDLRRTGERDLPLGEIDLRRAGDIDLQSTEVHLQLPPTPSVMTQSAEITLH